MTTDPQSDRVGMSAKKASKRKMTPESSTNEETKTDHLSLVSTDNDGEKPKKVQASSEQPLENLMPTVPEQGEAQVNEEQGKEQATETMRSADNADITEPEQSMQIAAAGPGPIVQGADGGGDADSSSHSQPLYPDTWRSRTPARPATARQDPPSTGSNPDSAHNLCEGEEGSLWAATVAANPDLQQVRTRRASLGNFYEMVGYTPPALPPPP